METLIQRIPWMLGGSADLSESTKTPASHSNTFQPGSYQEQIVWFGVREHGMGAAMNGMSAHGGVITYGGTFLTFSDYMRGAIRLAALSHLPLVYIFTHDSIGLGEDGPTHQPVEQVMSLRLIPNLTVLRPGDANETVASWKAALTRRDGPTALILSRQKLAVFAQTATLADAGVQHGAYVLSDPAEGTPELLLLATGSELELAMAAQTALASLGRRVRVVSFPSWELFAAQPQAYRDQVLPPNITARISIEAGVTTGWQLWVGLQGVAMGVDHFGASAPYKTIYKEFGLTVEDVVAHAQALLGGAA
jgi:transketolase